MTCPGLAPGPRVPDSWGGRCAAASYLSPVSVAQPPAQPAGWPGRAGGLGYSAATRLSQELAATERKVQRDRVTQSETIIKVGGEQTNSRDLSQP